MNIRVVIGEDHGLVREGLVALLEREPGIQVTGQARTGTELLQLARKLEPDMVVADIGLPLMNGIEVVRRLRADAEPCKCLCLSACDRPQQVLAALEAGAGGYVLKDNSFEELARGIRRVMANQIFLSGELIGAVMHACRHPDEAVQAIRVPKLSARERQITQLFAEGHSTQAIAGQLCLSPKTVATHRENIFHKLGIGTIAELTRFALHEGMTTHEVRVVPSSPVQSAIQWPQGP